VSVGQPAAPVQLWASVWTRWSDSFLGCSCSGNAACVVRFTVFVSSDRSLVLTGSVHHGHIIRVVSLQHSGSFVGGLSGK
jgi:hypothetical protein